ncbi:MAG TPA: hypothetical protein VFZ25_04825 [Chloroflexota bacterium]|nr:hypothetical protein [Chloroflexota bacterium]
MTLLVENLRSLVPTVFVLLGAVAVCGIGWILPARPNARPGTWLPVAVGEACLALAFGFIIRLAIVTFRQTASTTDPFSALTSATPGPATTGVPIPAILGVARPDSLSLVASAFLLALAVAALVNLFVPSPRAVIGVLVATAAAVQATLSPAPLALGIAWLVLTIAPLLDRQPEMPGSDDAVSAGSGSIVANWLLFGVCAAAILEFADATLAASGSALVGAHPAPRGVSALLVLLAASSAGVGPLGGIVRKLVDDGGAAADVGEFVGAGALPVAGFLLAARVLVESSAAPTLLLRGFLVILALWSVGEIVVGQRSHPGRLARGLIALAFLSLAALSVPLSYVGFGVLVGGIVFGLAGARLLPGPQTRAALLAVPDFGLADWREELAVPRVVSDSVRDLAALLRRVEERYDLAVGLLLALAVVLAFAR